MRRSIASCALVGFSLTALVAFAQAPAQPTPPAQPPAPSGTPPAVPPAESAAPSAAPAPEPAPSDSAAPPAAPPVSSVAVGTPSTNGPSPPKEPPRDRGVEPERPKSKPDPWQDGHAIGAEGMVYVSGRFGPTSLDANEEERFGAGFDLSAWLTLSKEYVLGFGLTHADLGNVTSGHDADGVDIDYTVTSTYLGARAFPWRESWAEVFIGLRVGLAWQGIDAIGVRTAEPNVSAPEPFTCSAGAGPGLALGAGLGGALRLGSRAWFTGQLDVNGYKLTSDVVDGCVAGIGSVTNATLGAGLLYAFDIGAENRIGAAERSRAQTW